MANLTPQKAVAELNAGRLTMEQLVDQLKDQPCYIMVGSNFKPLTMHSVAFVKGVPSIVYASGEKMDIKGNAIVPKTREPKKK